MLLALLLCGGTAPAGGPTRSLPEHCAAHVGAGSDADWGESYRRGLGAIAREDFALAEREMCAALAAVRDAPARDWRFAETLDELGLIAFSLRDYELAERVQGAAIAEMLLAVGPRGEPFDDRAPSDQAPIRPDCRSGIGSYTTRLGWIHERVAGPLTAAELGRAPWRVFAAGYVPLDERLASRLDWLVAQYLLEENLTATDELGELQRRIRAGER